MPERNTPEYYAMGLIDQILLQGDDSRIRQAIVKDRGLTGSVDGGINLLGNMFNYNGPMLWMGSLFHDSNVPADSIIAALDSVMIDLATNPVDQEALDRAIVKMRSNLYDAAGGFFGFGRADLLASFALFDNDPARINSLEEEFRKVTPELILRTAQEYLRTTNRTVLTVEPTFETPQKPAG
jgi:zinc protease